ncbi:hypothetical protein An04g05340 [Aspergillus niger]|uniref:Uncharacterized protein n=2 Tax=Aspergillus niger TaxID=5061 RepID=A2QJ02_ASPNC|nr:hypothetical protein An04g05340 [Aspergillus niger]CAK38796.1 hypothetical protein An04g05340 [Aspergillus niger]
MMISFGESNTPSIAVSPRTSGFRQLAATEPEAPTCRHAADSVPLVTETSIVGAMRLSAPLPNTAAIGILSSDLVSGSPVRPNDFLGRAWHYDLTNEGLSCNHAIVDPPILHERKKSLAAEGEAESGLPAARQYDEEFALDIAQGSAGGGRWWILPSSVQLSPKVYN